MSRAQLDDRLAALMKRARDGGLDADEIADALENATRELETEG